MSSEAVRRRSVRRLLGDLHDSQSKAEASHYANEVVARAEEDLNSISEFIHCNHVDWDDLLAEKMKEAGWTGGKLSGSTITFDNPSLTKVVPS